MLLPRILEFLWCYSDHSYKLSKLKKGFSLKSDYVLTACLTTFSMMNLSLDFWKCLGFYQRVGFCCFHYFELCFFFVSFSLWGLA